MQFLSKSFPVAEDHIIMATGGVSICVSIISAIMTYLKLGERSSAHLQAQMAWQTFYNSIKHQLSLTAELREDPQEFLQKTKTAYDRLFELSPLVGDSFISAVRRKVQRNSSAAFQVPCYLNGYQHQSVFGQDDYEDNTEASEHAPEV
jgi:hypothetical protein